jgi:Tol biopolymer transport system component
VLARTLWAVLCAALLTTVGDGCSLGGNRAETEVVPTTRETESAPNAVVPGRMEGLILFWKESPWPSIWSVRPDGSHLRWAYRTHQNAKRPTLSPDGKWIAFDGAPPGKTPLSDFDLEIVRRDGTGLRTLTRSPQWDLDAQWSPDGALLSFSRFPPHQVEEAASVIWTVRRNGSGLRRLVRGFGARWSPDGKRLVFAAPMGDSDGDLFVMNADGTERRLLLATPEAKQAAAWSPDGRKILFTSFDRSAGADVFVMDADGTHVHRLTEPGATNIAAAWSPDGSKNLFTRGPPGNAELLLIDADGSHERTLSDDRFRGYEPSWR